MRFRVGAVIGFAVGYYLGAKAGRVRYEQIRRTLERAQPLGKAVALVELGIERIRGGAEGIEEPTVALDTTVSSN